jgi:nicotinamide-nucleotide adenylyltransferase
VARWRPVHLGHAAVLRALCQKGRQVVIGIGSSNRYNLRNPFTLEETLDMLQLVLQGYTNFTLIPIPDLGDGPRWRELVRNLLGPLDIFLTDNPYVASLMGDVYPLAHPSKFLSLDEQFPIDGTMVRKAMAQDTHWRSLIPPPVAKYILANHLDERFRREFGLQTLSLETIIQS